MSLIDTVLVVGGGIGGLTAAAAFAQRGAQVDLIEVNPHSAVYGVGIIQPANALRALREIGVLEACLAAGYQTDEQHTHDAAGNVLGIFRSLRLAGPELPANNMLPRPALARILGEAAAAAGARVRLGVEITGLTQSPHEVTVSTSDGLRARYDLVVGADGIRSQLRLSLFGVAIEPEFTGHGCWRVNVPKPPALTYMASFLNKGCKAGLIPLTPETMYLLLTCNEPGNPRIRKDESFDLLRRKLSGFGGLIAEVRDALTADDDIVYVPIEKVTVPPPWHRGRVVLIGDAAHACGPQLAQGAAMAIEDAIVLAGEASSAMSLEQLFGRFMDRRYARCKYVQDLSTEIGEQDQNLDEAKYRQRVAAMRALKTTDPKPFEVRLAEPM